MHSGRKDDEFREKAYAKGDIVIEDAPEADPPTLDELVVLLRELYEVSVGGCDAVLKELGVGKLAECHPDDFSKARRLIRSQLVAHRQLEPAAD